jgi:hypothetical protein
MTRGFTVTRAEARELKRRDDKATRVGAVPHDVVRARWLKAMARELRQMVRAYERTGRGARELLEALVIAEVEGAPGVSEIRRGLGRTIIKRRAA